MKRIISILLCAAILFSSFAMCISAETHYLREEASLSPTVNGVISDGEYSNTTGPVSTAEGGNGIIIPYTPTNPLADHVVQYYWTYDADYLYLGYSGIGDMNTMLCYYLNPNVASGVRDTIRLVINCSWGNLGDTSAQLYTADSISEDLVWSDYVAECATDNWDTGHQNVNVVEVKIKRSALNNSDTVGVRAMSAHEGGARGEFYWGADPASSVIPYQDIWFYNKAGFNVLKLSTCKVDGMVDRGEYRFTSGQIDTAVSSEIFSAYYPANENGYTAEFLYDFDEENIYIAYIGEKETKSSLRFYIGPQVALGERDTYRFILDYTWNPFDSSAGDVANVTYNGEITRHVATKWTADKSADYAGEAIEWGSIVNNLVGGNFDNTHYNTNVIEFSIKKSALGDIANGKIGISAFIDGDASGNVREGIWGATTADGSAVAEGAVAPYNDGTWTIGVKAGYHVVDIRSYTDQSKLSVYGQKQFYVQEATAENTPVPVSVDGTVTKGEYNFFNKTTFSEGVSSNDAFVTVGGSDSVTGLDIYATHDDTNVYFAIKVADNAYDGYDYFYLNVAAGYTMNKFLQVYMPKYGVGDLYGNIELWPSGVTSNGQLDKATYVPAAAGTVVDGGYVYEVAINKAALMALCDVNTIERIFCDGYLPLWAWEYDENGDPVLNDSGNHKGAHRDRIAFGFTSDDLSGIVPTVHGNTYAHVLNLSAGAKCETHTYDDSETAYASETQHKRVCNVCGYIDYAAHTLSETERVNPTYTEKGHVIYECVSENGSCGTTRVVLPIITLPEDKHLLTLTAQEHVFVAKATAVNSAIPTVDGVITSGEYNFTKLITPENGVANNVSQLQSMRLYFTYDDETVYVAAVVTDNDVVVGDYVDCIDIHFNGSDDIDAGYHFYVTPSGSGAFEWSTTVSGGQTNKVMSAPANAARAVVVDGKIITYEVSIDRTEWGLDGNKMFLSVSARSTAGTNERLTYGFLSDQITGENVLHNAGAYPHVMFLGESSNEGTPKGDFADYLEGTALAYTACQTHSYGATEYVNTTTHKQICTACGYVAVSEHSYGEGNVTKDPNCTESGTTIYTCSACQGTKEVITPATGHSFVNNICSVCGTFDSSVIPADRHLLTETAQKHNFVVKATESNSAIPTIDGIITSGEYNWSAKNITDIDTSANISDFDLYFTYDDTNVYIAAVVTDEGEYTSHKQAVFVYFNGDSDISDAWRIYLCKENGTGVEHWQYTDGVEGTNLWNPTKGYSYKLVQNGAVYTYELSLNRADWGLTDDKLYLMVTAQSTDGTVKYAFNETKYESIVPTIGGAYPHVMFLGEKSAHTEYLADTALAYTACAPHTYAGTEYLNNTYHKSICTVCGYVNLEGHDVVSSTVTKVPTFAETGILKHTCSSCVGYEEAIDTIAVPDDGHFLQPAGQKQFFIGAASYVAPIADGKINDGEYAWSQTGMYFSKGMNNGNGTDNRFWMLDDTGDSKYFNIYASYDDTYIYLAARVVDTYTLTDKLGSMVFRVSANSDMTAGCERYGLYYNRESGYDINGSLARHDFKVGETIDVENKLAIQEYELVLLRSDFMNGEEPADTFYFSAVVQSDDANGINNNSTDVEEPWKRGGEAFFGFRYGNDKVAEKHYFDENFKDRLPHVLYLGKDLASLENDYKTYFGEDMYTNWYTDCGECDNVILQGRDSHKYVCVSCGSVRTEGHTSSTWSKLDHKYHVLECETCGTVYEEHVADESYEVTTTGATLTVNAYKNLHCSICNETVEGYIPPTNGHFLGAYGQKHFFLPANNTPHKIDGVASPGEYFELASTDFTADGTATNSAFLMSGPRENGSETNSIEGMTVYANYDADKLYLAAKFDDFAPESGDYLYFYIGASEDMSENLFIYFPNYGMVSNELEVWVNTASQSTANMEEAQANAEALGIVTQGSKIGGEVTYEVSIPLDKIEEVFGIDALDKFYLYAKYINVEEKEDTQILYFAVDDDQIPESISGINGDKYAHVVFLGDVAAHNAYLTSNEITHTTCAEHIWQYVATADGHTEACLVCGAVGAEAEHSTVIKPAHEKTCDENGWLEHEYCTVCGFYDMSVIIPAPGHDFNDVPAKAPTCTEEGWIEHQKCTNCNYYDPNVIIEALGHAVGMQTKENVIAPTCGTAGSYDFVKYCGRCNEELIRNHVEGGDAGDATGAHSYTLVARTKEATCTEDGYIVMACEVCLNESENTVILAHGHLAGDAVDENETVATCTTPASKDSVIYCTMCNDELSRITLITGAPLAHTPVIDPAVPATCTATGLTEGQHCSECNEVIVAQTVVPAKGHSEQILQAVAATCTSTGLTEGKKCTVCGVTTVSQTVVGILPHSYSQTVTAPNCTTAGYTTHTCTACGDTYTDNQVAALGHSYDDGVITTPASCYRPGVKTFTCESCGAKITEATDKVDHTYATAEDLGNDAHRFTCEVCSVTRTDKHTFVGGVCKCGAVPESIFELSEQGQQHTYVGEAAAQAPVITGDAFEAEKYNQIATLVADDMAGSTKNDYFYWSEGMQIGHFKIYITYDAATIYLAAEVDAEGYDDTDTMTFTLATGRGESSFALSGENIGQTNEVFKSSNVFAATESAGRVYAVEIDRANLAAVTQMTTGEAVDDQVTVSATYDNGEGSATYGVVLEENVGDIAEAEESVGHAVSLSSTETNSSFNATDENTEESIDVFGTYSDEGVTEVISVSVSWDVATFTYTAKFVWNAEDLTNDIDAENSGWSTDPTTVTVINHSNAAISVEFDFETSMAESGIDGKFTATESFTAAEITSVTLTSAAMNNQAVAKTVYFYVTAGELPGAQTEATNIGNITITISPEGN